MKEIAVVVSKTGNVSLAENIKQDLMEVFGNSVKINTFFLDMMDKADEIKADAVLTMTSSVVSNVKNHVKDIKKIIAVTRTLSREAVDKINKIPKNSKILVVSDMLEATYEVVTLIYQLGIHSLDLIPYIENSTNPKEFQIAITPGVKHKVLGEIKTVIDIGNRKLDTQTFFNLFNLLSINDDIVNKNLINYMNNLVEKNTGIKKKYLTTYLLSEALKKVVKASTEGILLIDTEDEIVYCNSKAIQILGNRIGNGIRLYECLDKDMYELLESENFVQELIKIDHEDVLVNKTVLYSLDEISGYYFSFNTVRNINEIRTDLSSHLREKGLFARYMFDTIVYKSEIMKICIDNAKKIALTDSTVLINGETGTGKELLAQSIHNYSKRSNKPFVAVNCAALPESLLESELFGYEGGAFTGSKKEGKLGIFEQANKGTIFLDEIGDMPLSLQARLLRVIQEKQIMRIGSNKVIDIDVRIITATNKILKHEVKKGNFREDLFYRLNVLPISIPPLRERPEDILVLFQHFIGAGSILTPEIKQHILNYSWPGNIRELKNVADYYKLMKNVNIILDCPDLKEYRQTQLINYSFPADRKTISAILCILLDHNNRGEGIGRNKLIMELKAIRESVSENKLEKIFRYLKENEYITREKGRGGVRLTRKGIDFYREIADTINP
jgi:transcriptional regulator with PAS, ATPase and Fis domain